MNNRSEHTKQSDDAVEAVLRRAQPRRLPPAEDERAIRDAVRGEWQKTVDKPRKGLQVRYLALALAASLLLALTFAVILLGPSPTEPDQVARIDKSFGAIYLLGARSELVEIGGIVEPEIISSGQIIQTGDDAALGLVLESGASLRADENTRIEFLAGDRILLHRGRLYFDSTGRDVALVVDTDQGSVTHLGTQYMASLDDDALVVSIREGRVKVDGRYYDETASAGQQLSFRGSARPTRVNLPAWANTWSWVESLAPGIDLADRSADEFIRWVGRETGLTVEYADDDSERVAKDTRLRGNVESNPRAALRLRLMTTDLEYEFIAERGVIRVRLARPPDR